jgi:O-Antigen ligase
MVGISLVAEDISPQRAAQDGPTGPPGAGPRGALAVAPVALALVLLSIAVLSDGAFALRQWGPIAFFGLVVLALAPRTPLKGAALALVAAAWAYALWSLLSVSWAEEPGRAIEGAGRNLLYAALVSLPLATLPDRRSGVRMAWTVTAGLAAVVILTFVSSLSDGPAQFLAGRLNDPVGYRNATAALMAMAFWPLVCLAAQRAPNPLLRAASFSAATTALGLAFLTQSRGVLIGFTCGAIVALALGPDRLRRAWLTIMAVAGVAIVSPRLLNPYDAFLDTATNSSSAIHAAMSALTLLTIVSFAVALLLALFDGGVRMSEGAQRTLARLSGAVLVLITVGAIAGGLVAVGNPVQFVRDKASEFKQLDTVAPGETRLGSTSGQRYDLWRVAWKEFRSAPLIGVGEGSYPQRYYVERQTDRNLSTPHSLPIAVLAETGLVGLLLLLAMPVAAFVAVVRGWRALPPPARRPASALLATAAVMLGQSTVDWLWQIPAMAGLGLICLALGVAIVSAPETAPALAKPRLPLRIVAIAVPALAALLVGAIYLSDLDVRLARADRAGTPQQQLKTARTAQRLNPLALPPRYLQAGALESLGRREAARKELLAALDREPKNFVTMALLGDLEVRAGHPGRARIWYRRALKLNPIDVGLRKLAGAG